MAVAILTHEAFPDRAKTAVGLLRYGDRDVRALVDRERAGQRVHDALPDVQDAPIVASMADVPDVDALVIGISPIGGEFDESWREDVRTALKRGCDVYAGLHDFLADDEEFARLAAEHDAELHDLRKPPADLTVAAGTAGDVDATVVTTVGTDCSTGKMTASFEIRDAARERGLDAAVVPTGQTGIAITGRGIVVDRVIADYAAGAVERLVQEAQAADLLVVEGQGALAHPAYSGVTTSILHGSVPDALVMCHEAGREAIHGYESFAIPPLSEYVDIYERLAAPISDASVVAGMLNTHHLDDDAAANAVTGYSDALGAPATDPVRHGVPEEVLDAIL
ncbi:Uncharacterized conserved protein, NAD-dependent epimerase/dehydratase family [Haloarcula vallismortis]|uniref:DUF1611 domain-containing protein n=2 Tax=Haloarcula vallismortis TaxID=28442 RepID=M0IZZ3_HALVA|nr:DUF1611 domain-containing protein [Haloarcula vallismortis]EMA01005.1 hypothetical protein C437_19462 [Haloarcula vallismortis ATCC 29715]SDW12476.1 Uncharacterized conserved protein, NAD-dependent epimerase/dehydratase family [Haloarcula vallismortis]